MYLNENDYETALLYQLPPNARDLAQDLVDLPLASLLQKLSQDPDPNLLSYFKVHPSYWERSVKAAILIKITYFLPNKKFTEAEILYLIKASVLALDYSLNDYSLTELLEKTKMEYPIFNRWLKTFSHLLIKKHYH